MFADPEIPVGMADPFHVELVLESKPGLEIRTAKQFVKNHAIVNPLDPHLAAIFLVEKLRLRARAPSSGKPIAMPSIDSVAAKSIRVFCFSGSISSRTTFSGSASAIMVRRNSSR